MTRNSLLMKRHMSGILLHKILCLTRRLLSLFLTTSHSQLLRNSTAVCDSRPIFTIKPTTKHPLNLEISLILSRSLMRRCLYGLLQKANSRLSVITLGSLSTRVFETRTATGSELFSFLTCPYTTTFTLPSIFSPLEMISIKIWETPLSWHAKCSLPVAVRVSKTRVLKLPIDRCILTRFLLVGTLICHTLKGRHCALYDNALTW